MSDKPKKNLVSIRLTDEDLEKLEMLSDSNSMPKGTMATSIVENALNENNQEFEINHICYPRPIIKKLFRELEEKQIILMVVNTNNYNKDLIVSAKRYCTPQKILNELKKTWKKYGFKIRTTKFEDVIVLEIHHELDKNWSKVTSATTSFILELLDYKIKSTFVSEDWFKIEYVEKS